jgi:hypothetical protein
MASPSSESSRRDPLQNVLDNAETELRRRLEEACEAEAKGIPTESTEQIRKLEDKLLAAALAAKETLAVRDQMQRRTHAERERSIKIDVAADRGKQDLSGVHEFSDDEGRPWRAWSVVPGLTRASASGQQFLGNFQDGWICFEALGSPARRRIPYPRDKWANISDAELRHLLQRAIDAPIRQKKTAEGTRIDR